MSAYDPKLHEQQRESEVLKARLDRQERMTGLVGIVATVLAVLALALYTDCLLADEWPLHHLLSFIL
jgi:predicted lysophospholipase L1 biosynthesis ABC-type transport system permease subunit